METQAQHQERIAIKIAGAKWPDGLEVPKSPTLRLSGKDGNVFSIFGRAKQAADKAKWTEEQWKSFRAIAEAGDYDHALQTCMRYFDVR